MKNISDSSRILQNTISLYLRMFILILVSLFTVRIVLKVLGAEDYGLFNVVAGFVSMFTFLSGTLILSSQRYFAVCISKNDWTQLNKYFSIIFTLYILLIILIIILSQTVGLWFVSNKLNIPPHRKVAAILIYEFSILSFIVTLLGSPFIALFVADENLGIYSVVSIIEGVFKVVVAYLLLKIEMDKLVVYGVLLFIVSFIINSVYFIYSLRRYKKLIIKINKTKKDFIEILTFFNWNLIGAFASVGKAHGINIIINLFFGGTVNAARSIAFQVNNVLKSFSQNFMKAVDPQIIKVSEHGDTDKLAKLILTSSKISFFLLYIIAVPLIANMSYVLTVWLGDVPDYTVIFTILTLVDALVLSISDPIFTGVQATGIVRKYQIVVGGLALLNLPLAYFLLKLFCNPLLPFAISILVSILMGMARIIIYGQISSFSVFKYITNLTIAIGPVIFSSSIIVWHFFSNATSILELIINTIITVLIISVSIYFLGLKKYERSLIRGLFSKIINKLKRSGNATSL